MEGDWENGSHGLQLKVDSFMEIVPRTKAGIIGYLSSGAIKGVKQRTAEAIYQQFGLQTLDVIEKSPEKLLSIRPYYPEPAIYAVCSKEFRFSDGGCNWPTAMQGIE